MKKILFVFIILCLVSSANNKVTGYITKVIVEDSLNNKLDSVILNSLLVEYQANQEKLLEKQDSLINLLK